MREKILRNKTNKVHPQLDLLAARTAFFEAGVDRPLSGELVTSAFDLHAVESLRDSHGLRIGDPVATDIIVFGRGEPDNPSCTKVGGRPLWPADRAWPTASDGSPCYFLAQFNFADSRDILPDLPADMLLLLTDSENDWLWGDDGSSFHWVRSDEKITQDICVPSTVGAAGPFFGAIFRTADYPDSQDKAYALQMSQSYNLPILNGTKIGGLPHFIQGGEGQTDGFLCQLGSIQAASDVPFPWVNQAEPLSLKFDNTGIYGDNNCAVFGDMGSIYLFLEDDGNVTRGFECY